MIVFNVDIIFYFSVVLLFRIRICLTFVFIVIYRFSQAPWLFILTACRFSENKRFRIVDVLMFPVAA